MQTTSTRSPHQNRAIIAFLVVDLILSVFILTGVPEVPFHPDESTFLYLSADFERLFTDPASMAWQPALTGDVVQRYRTLDAPLGRYLVGVGRWLAGLPALPVDWDWGSTWEQNQQAGAVPDPKLLLAGRYALAVLLPVSILLMYLTGRRAGGEFTGWAAALLLASNALVLMLGRRSISEGALVFTSAWTLFSLTQTRRLWISSLPAALAFCAKHSLGALAPVAGLAVLWQPGVKISRRIAQAGAFLAIYAAVVIALNPFVWAHPLAALQAAGDNRRVLAAAQVADRPEQALSTPGMRLIGMIGALYLTPPRLAETGNYLEDTRGQDEAYLSNPFNRLLRSLPAGGLLLVLTIFGWVVGVRKVVRPGWDETGGSPDRRRWLALLALAALLQTAALFVLVPLPFQRYYLPLVPHACLWAAFGLRQAGAPFIKAIRTRKNQPRMA